MKACRIDKYVWCVRLVKTRSIASSSITKNKIKLNGAPVKPSKEVQLGDEINVTKHNSTFTFRIIQLLDRRVGAKLVKDYLIETTPPEEMEKFKLYQESQRTYRDNGSGKPSKKERRDLDDFMNDWE